MDWYGNSSIKKSLILSFFCGLLGCSIPSVDTNQISTTPASSQSFAVAKRAVRACKDLPNHELVLNNFRQSGFGVSKKQVAAKNGRMLEHAIISSPDKTVSVLVGGGVCYVGLENMTPTQSAQLAEIWVNSYGALPNSAFGNGLSDHVSGAWRKFFTVPAKLPDHAAYHHKVYIAAYKTWPYGPYDPQSNFGYDISEIFPPKRGAAVELTHVVECDSVVKTGPRTGVFLPCKGSPYRPK